ncbi:MAG: mucoidy inhibitor MuiA family protein [Actinomycetota bacterium]
MTIQETSNQPATATVDSRIREVTVYTNQARVTRCGSVSLSGNERELVISSIPTTIQTESVRATGAGEVAVRLLGVRTEKVFGTEPVAELAAKLTKQIKQLEEQKRVLTEQLASRQLQLQFVQSLSDKTVGFFSSGLAKQQVSLNETGELLNFIGQNYRKYASAIAQYEKQLQQLNQQIEALRQQLQKVQTARPLESFNIIVTIEPSGSGEFNLEVSYVVNRASWIPFYDLRVNTTDNQINLTYLAEVSQNTGEDWTDVALTLSTAKPGLGTLPPKLHPWYVDVFHPVTRSLSKPSKEGGMAKRLRSPSASYDEEEEESFGGFREAIASEPLYAAAPAPIAAQTATATVSREGGIVTFQIGGNTNIPNDGTPHKVTIFSENYPTRPEYIAVPRLVSFAYLQAVVLNPLNGVTLLPGQANIFRDNTFVGTTELENVSPGQEFKLNLGIDEGVKIERDLVERQVEKKLIGNQRRTSYAYRLMITNLQAIQTSLLLREQLPVSRDEQIKVRLTLINPKIQQGEMGLLEWSIDLPPQAKQEVYYQFVVEYPPELTVVGLNI